jgi:hypothetical protein
MSSASRTTSARALSSATTTGVLDQRTFPSSVRAALGPGRSRQPVLEPAAVRRGHPRRGEKDGVPEGVGDDGGDVVGTELLGVAEKPGRRPRRQAVQDVAGGAVEQAGDSLRIGEHAAPALHRVGELGRRRALGRQRLQHAEDAVPDSSSMLVEAVGAEDRVGDVARQRPVPGLDRVAETGLRSQRLVHALPGDAECGGGRG